MPRHASNNSGGSSSRTALTAPSINLLPAALVQLQQNDNASSSPNISSKALSRRRHILKHIPQIQTTEAPPNNPSAGSRSPSSPDKGAPTSRLFATNLGEFGNLPVVRAGATFLSTLHTSVALSASLHPPSNPASGPPSPCLFPQISSSSSHPPATTTVATVRRRLSVAMASSPSTTAENNNNNNNNGAGSPAEEPATSPAPLPSLDFVEASTIEERTDGLKLVADSIAQRRQLASYALMTHPYFLGLMGALFAGVYQMLYKSPSDWALVFTTSIGVLMAGFVGIRGAVKGYLELAEEINFAWLEGDEMVVARWGDGDSRKVIGSIVYKVEKASGSGNGRKGRKIATVRAWTTGLRMRGNGVGKGLVEEMARQSKKKGVEEIRWGEENIYERRILPKWANGGFESGLKEARTKLEGYVKEFQGQK